MRRASRERQTAIARHKREEVAEKRHVGSRVDAVDGYVLTLTVDDDGLAAGERVLHAHDLAGKPDLHGRASGSRQLEPRPRGPRPADLERRARLLPRNAIGNRIEQREGNVPVPVLEQRRPSARIGADDLAVLELGLIGQP